MVRFNLAGVLRDGTTKAGALLCFQALSVCSLWLAGCDSGTHRPPSVHPLPKQPLVSQAQPGRFGGRFALASDGFPKTFNPLQAGDRASESITRLLFGEMVNVNPVTHESTPGLAESWSVEDDHKTWTFKLRQGINWSDGQPLSAEDVVFTWNDIMYDPQANPATYGLFQANGQRFIVTNLDAFTVRVVTPEVFAPFVEFFGSVFILPKHTLERVVKEGHFQTAYGVTTRPDRVVGCGPFRLREFRAGEYTMLEANPEYWVTDKQGRRLPYFDEIKLTMASETDPTWQSKDAQNFLKGKTDVFEVLKPEMYSNFKQESAKGRFQLVDLGAGTQSDFLWFNQNTDLTAAGTPFVPAAKLKWFRNKTFRQAISCALDRERMGREVYEGRAQPAYTLISADNRQWYNPQAARYSYDPVKARALLTEIGMADRKGTGWLEDPEGNPLEIVMLYNTGNVSREKTARRIEEDLKQIGIKLVALPIDYRALVLKIGAQFDYEAALMGLGGGDVDPASQVNVLRSSEDLHQWFPFQKTPSTAWEARIDSLMDSQMRTLNMAERKKYFDEVQAILADEMPMIYTTTPLAYAAIRSDVSNLRPSVMSPYHLTWNLEELYFKGTGQ